MVGPTSDLGNHGPLSMGQRVPRQLFRALALRCPVCGTGRLFCGPFRMHRDCPACGVSFEREPGFFLGSIYFNYGITALLVLIAYMLLRFGSSIPRGQVLAITVAVAIVFPVIFFRHARSLWMGFDQLYDPRLAGSPPSEGGERAEA